MSQLKALRSATTLSDLATLLDVKPGMLSHELYHKPKPSLYSKFTIPKRYGGTREISAPNKTLKLMQHRLSELLLNCSAEINESLGQKKETVTKPGISHGFKPGHSIITNARPHVVRQRVFNIDLENFFGTINFGRVRGFFISNKHFCLNPKVATVIAQIACNENRLPQGSPCSPVISNLIGHSLDILMVRLSKATDCTYTRYVDDLTFSSNKPKFSSRVAYQPDPNFDFWEAGFGVKRALKRAGFALNDKKTRMQYRDSRQVVTGLTVNRKPNVTATYRNRLRAMAHALFTKGTFDFVGADDDGLGGKVVSKKPGKVGQLIGMLAYVDYIDLENRKVQELNGVDAFTPEGRLSLFRRALYFQNFYAPSEPVVVCEGKTDNVYLRCAIKSLAASFPKLAAVGTPPRLRLRLFKYDSKRRTDEVTEIKGGTGGLCKLIKHYHDEVSTRFKAPPPKHPVIVLIDNDQGKDGVLGAIAGITKKHKPTGKEPFIHVVANLYVVLTPLDASGGETMIEDFFKPATLAVQLDGKTFSPGKDADTAKNYSKAVFALKVVAEQAATIDFSGFTPLLDRIVMVLDDYATKHPSAVSKSSP